MKLSDLASPLAYYWEDGVVLARPIQSVVLGYTSRRWADARVKQFYPVKGLIGHLRQPQEHTNWVIHDQSPFYPHAFDGSYTQRPFWQLNGLFADCLPVYIGHEKGEWIGLVHCGWRGSLGRVAENLLNSLWMACPSSADKWWAVLGPYCWGEDYEIQEEFKEQFFSQLNYSWLNKCFWQKEGKFYFDNGLFTLHLLNSLGLNKLSYLPLNTACNSDFYSHRKGDEGRNLAFIYKEG